MTIIRNGATEKVCIYLTHLEELMYLFGQLTVSGNQFMNASVSGFQAVHERFSFWISTSS
jgi:hypothetical protein